MQVRIMTPDDEDEVISLLKDFMLFEKVDLLSDEGYRTVFRTVLGRPERMRFVVAETDKLVGMLTVIFGYSTWKAKPIAIIEDLYVKPEMRGCGVASALLAYAFELARESGCDRIDLVTETDNYPAQELYKKSGFLPVQRIPFTRPL